MNDTNPSAGRRTFLKGTGAVAASSVLGGVASANGDGNGNGNPRWGKRVVGYYPSWAGDYTPDDVPYEKITHLNFAFLEPASNGEVTVGVTGDDTLDLLEDLREKTHEHENTSFMFSISSGWYSGRFSDAASTAENRERFAETAIDLVQEYNFDGIDIDWEYPDGTIRDEDPQNLTLLLEEIRRQFDELEAEEGEGEGHDGDGNGHEDGHGRGHDGYELSMAVAPLSWNADPLEVSQIDEYVDFLNVMNYNFHGAWSSLTNFNAPLYVASDDPNANPLLSVDSAMQYWADRPIDNEKLTFGLPFYGRSFESVPDDNDGLYQPFDGSDALTYYDIRQNYKSQSDFSYHWHDEAKVPWLYSPEDELFISYDDENAVAEKAQYTVDHGFGGIMCWELSQDASNTLIDSIHSVFTDPKNRGNGNGEED